MSPPQPSGGAINGGTYQGLLQAANLASSTIANAAENKSRTATGLARMGAMIYERTEKKKIEDEALYLGPIKSMLSSQGIQQLAKGDQSGWNFVQAAQGVGANNPLLERMNNDITGAAQQVSQNFMNTALTEQKIQMEREFMTEKQIFEERMLDKEIDAEQGILNQQIAAGRYDRPPRGGGDDGRVMDSAAFMGGRIQDSANPVATRTETPEAAQDQGVTSSGDIEGLNAEAEPLLPEETIILSDGTEVSAETAANLLAAGSIDEQDIPEVKRIIAAASAASESAPNVEAVPDAPAATADPVTPEDAAAGVVSDAPVVLGPPTVETAMQAKTPQEAWGLINNPNAKITMSQFSQLASKIPGLEIAGMNESGAMVAGAMVAVIIPPTQGSRSVSGLKTDFGGKGSMTAADDYPYARVKDAREGLKLITENSAILSGNAELTEVLGELGGIDETDVGYIEVEDGKGNKSMQLTRTINNEIVKLPIKPLPIKFAENFDNIKKGFALVKGSQFDMVNHQTQQVEGAKVLPEWVASLPQQDQDNIRSLVREYAGTETAQTETKPPEVMFTRDQLYKIAEDSREEDGTFTPDSRDKFKDSVNEKIEARMKSDSPETYEKLQKERVEILERARDQQILKKTLEVIERRKESGRLTGSALEITDEIEEAVWDQVSKIDVIYFPKQLVGSFGILWGAMKPKIKDFVENTLMADSVENLEIRADELRKSIGPEK